MKFFARRKHKLFALRIRADKHDEGPICTSARISEIRGHLPYFIALVAADARAGLQFVLSEKAQVRTFGGIPPRDRVVWRRAEKRRRTPSRKILTNFPNILPPRQSLSSRTF